MTNQDCRQTVLDFVYDRGPFRCTEDLTGQAVSRKPHFFVDYYRRLPGRDRIVMNACLISALLGRDEELYQFVGIVLMVILYIAKEIDGTGLEDYRLDLLDVLKDPKRRESWDNELDQNPHFFQDRRYAIGLVNILVALQTPGILALVEGMAASSKSSKFRKGLEKAVRNRENQIIG